MTEPRPQGAVGQKNRSLRLRLGLAYSPRSDSVLGRHFDQ